MAGKIVFIGILLLLISLIVVASYTPSERDLIMECKLECKDVKNFERVEIKERYIECREECVVDSDICEGGVEFTYDLCKQKCSDNFGSDRRKLSKCNRECSKSFRFDKKDCSASQCKRDCSAVKMESNKDVNKKYSKCRRNCKYTALNDNITCEDGKYKAGEVYLEGCLKCECGYDGESDCDKQETCGFNKLVLDENSCVNSEGYWGKLCRGPYFRLRCSREEYCLCDGDLNFQCGVGEVCVHNFNIKIPSSTSEGFKDARGGELGDVGICAEIPELSDCGNGICENVVCSGGGGCGAAEMSLNCPVDCG
jgi:hypothetical protein